MVRRHQERFGMVSLSGTNNIKGISYNCYLCHQPLGALLLNKSVKEFLANYSPEVSNLAFVVRESILRLIPNIGETVDSAARIIAYGFGPKYEDMICVIIPSVSGLKLGFYKGKELPDPNGLLSGTGKFHRHVKITATEDISSAALRQLIRAAHTAYKTRKGKSKTIRLKNRSE